MKTKEVMNSTTDSRVYKIAHREQMEHTHGCCSRCHPRRGCNWSRSGVVKRNWKVYRKTQYKI